MHLTPEQAARLIELMSEPTEEELEAILNAEPVPLSPELKKRLLKAALGAGQKKVTR